MSHDVLQLVVRLLEIVPFREEAYIINVLVGNGPLPVRAPRTSSLEYGRTVEGEEERGKGAALV